MFSDDIVASIDCAMRRTFDMAFQLSALQRQLEAERTQASVAARASW